MTHHSGFKTGMNGGGRAAVNVKALFKQVFELTTQSARLQEALRTI